MVLTGATCCLQRPLILLTHIAPPYHLLISSPLKTTDISQITHITPCAHTLTLLPHTAHDHNPSFSSPFHDLALPPPHTQPGCMLHTHHIVSPLSAISLHPLPPPPTLALTPHTPSQTPSHPFYTRTYTPATLPAFPSLPRPHKPSTPLIVSSLLPPSPCLPHPPSHTPGVPRPSVMFYQRFRIDFTTPTPLTQTHLEVVKELAGLSLAVAVHHLQQLTGQLHGGSLKTNPATTCRGGGGGGVGRMLGMGFVGGWGCMTKVSRSVRIQPWVQRENMCGVHLVIPPLLHMCGVHIQ